MDSVGMVEEWVLCQDHDGFTYKILKRQRLLDPPSSTDADAEDRRRKLRKKKTLLKLQNRYQKEIHQWQLLSNNLRSMQHRPYQQQLQLPNPDQTFESPSTDIGGSDNASRSLLDKLLSQAEAQEAMIHDISSLCDIAESMCNTQQDLLAQSYIDLPIWSSPRELMATLCDE